MLHGNWWISRSIPTLKDLKTFLLGRSSICFCTMAYGQAFGGQHAFSVFSAYPCIFCFFLPEVSIASLRVSPIFVAFLVAGLYGLLTTGSLVSAAAGEVHLSAVNCPRKPQG